jgi:hypothetical protein
MRLFRRWKARKDDPIMSNTETVGTLAVVAKVDLSQINQGLADAQRAILQFGTKADASFAPVGEALKNLRGKTQDLVNSMAPAPAVTGQLARAVDKLKASVNPLGAAMDKFNRQMAEADRLFEKGAISAIEYTQAVSVLTERMEANMAMQGRMVVAHSRGGKAARVQAGEMLNLSRQFADIGVTAAMGMSPLMILIQQGPQIADIFAGMAARGLNVSTAMRAMAASTMTAMRAMAAATMAAAAPFAPLIAAAAAVAAVIGGSLAIAANKINKDVGDLTKGMGLTAEQMERVTKKSVTMGDVAVGVFKVLGEDLRNFFAPFTTFIGDKFKELTQVLGQMAKELAQVLGQMAEVFLNNTWFMIKTTAGSLVGLFQGVKASFSLLGPAIGDITTQAMNFVIAALEGALNNIRAKINILISMANAAAAAVGITAKLPTLPEMALGRLDNKNLGAASKAGEAFGTAFNKGMASTMKSMDKGLEAYGDRVSDAAVKRRQDQIRKQAEKAPKASAGGGSGRSGRSRGADNDNVPKMQPLKSVDLKDLSKISTSGVEEFIREFDKGQAEIQAAFAASIRGGLEAGMRGGIPGVIDYLGNRLKTKLLDSLANDLAAIFSTGTGGSVNTSAGGKINGLLTSISSIFSRGGPSVTGPGSSTGGIIATAAKIGSALFGIPGFASGTTYAPGGLALVGERGPELVNLPRGSRVNTASQTAAMSGNVVQHFHVNAQGAVLAAELRNEMQVIGIRSAMVGAQGGAMRARSQAQRSNWDRFA